MLKILWTLFKWSPELIKIIFELIKFAKDKPKKEAKDEIKKAIASLNNS